MRRCKLRVFGNLIRRENSTKTIITKGNIRIKIREIPRNSYDSYVKQTKKANVVSYRKVKLRSGDRQKLKKLQRQEISA